MILLYAGIGLIAAGLVLNLVFSAKQIAAHKEYERMPQRWEQVKLGYLHKRILCRLGMILGIVLLVIYLTINAD